jgi:glycolate oxidase FAD binding subunit
VTATLMNPTDLRGVRDAVLDSAGALAVAGAGTAAGWAGTLGPVDAVLDLRALTGVITHNPGDMTVSVRAGTPLRELNAELAGHGQHVALDAARVADGATVGGLLSTGDAGPGALVHGSLRDLVIGATLVLADGTVARTGGHVIKNVAGYDLAKLVHGAYGTLAVIAEVVLRLHPLPHATATLVLPCPLEEAAEHAARVLGGPYEPAALEVGVGLRAPARAGRGHGGRAAGAGGEGCGSCWGRRRAAGDAADPWDGHTGSPAGRSTTPYCGSGCAPPGSRGCSPNWTPAGPPPGSAPASPPSRLPADPVAVAAAHAAVHAAGGTSVLRSRPVGLDASAWVRHRPHSPCSAPSSRSSTPPAASDRAGSPRG